MVVAKEWPNEPTEVTDIKRQLQLQIILTLPLQLVHSSIYLLFFCSKTLPGGASYIYAWQAVCP